MKRNPTHLAVCSVPLGLMLFVTAWTHGQDSCPHCGRAFSNNYPSAAEAKRRVDRDNHIRTCAYRAGQGSPATGNVTSGPTPRQLAYEANKRGNQHYNRGEYSLAGSWFERALNLDRGNAYARRNLALVHQAIRKREANDAIARHNAEVARQVEAERRRREEERRRREEEKRKRAESNRRIDGTLERLKADFDGRDRSDPAESMPGFTGTIPADSSVVDLRDRTTDTVDPRKLKGEHPPLEPGEQATKASVLLRALEIGQGDWDESLNWLRRRVSGDPADLVSRDAFQFALGLSEGLGRTPSLEEDIDLPLPPGSSLQSLSRDVHQAVVDAIGHVNDQDFEQARENFVLAHRLAPDDIGIRDSMNWAEGLQAAAADQSHYSAFTEVELDILRAASFPQVADDSDPAKPDGKAKKRGWTSGISRWLRNLF